MESVGQISSIERTELMRLLDQLQARRITYIHAPAGYGKSFSTRLWLERRGCPCAWISMTEASGQRPADFCERLAIALFSLQPGNTELKRTLSQKSFASAPFEFAGRALKAFNAYLQKSGISEQNSVLIIDDLHLITSSDILKRLPEIIAELPECVTLFLLSRAEPPDSFSELVVKNKLAMVDVNSLTFSVEEIKALFTAHGQRITSEQAGEILAATGGWAIGLNAMLLSGNQSTGKKLLSRYLETFIREQVWENWDEARRKFLLCVSVADELTPDFCEAMTGRKDSAKILETLVRENAFISADENGVYRFHHLFRDFLYSQIMRENSVMLKELYQKAGDWFFARGDNYRAVEYYIKCGDKRGVTKGLKLMYDYNSPYASIEDTLSIIRLSVDGSIVEEYSFLLEVQAWAAFAEGDIDALTATIDLYYQKFPKIVLQNPKSAQTFFLIRLMDPRIKVVDYMKGIKNIPMKKALTQKAFMPSVSHNMPLFHRSNRDFSEFLIDIENSFALFRKTIGVFFHEEFDLIELCLRAGFAYENGNLSAAYELALSAGIMIKDGFAPELKFCAMMILANILDAQGNRMDMQKVLDGAAEMIERDQAFYLTANFRAFEYRIRLSDGDAEAAKDWLKRYADSPYCNLSFYKSYQHFTTARAYIVTGEYNTAILFLKKLLCLCEGYSRTLDIIEANILLAIAYWKKGRGMQNEAFKPLEKAIISAQEFGFTQIFENEGPELVNMLHRLQKRVSQKDYNGEFTGSMLKTIYISALSRAKVSRGLTGGRAPENLKFTDQQKAVMRHLCDGLAQKMIAEKMGLKPSAVKSHMILIYKKLDVTSGVDAMMKIRELGLLDVK